jgi:hypothetical protein
MSNPLIRDAERRRAEAEGLRLSAVAAAARTMPLRAAPSGRLYRKELIYVGSFRTPHMSFDVDDRLLHHWVCTFDAMSAGGIEVPVPVEHSTDPEARRGTLVRLELSRNDRGLTALYGWLRFRGDYDPGDAQVSIYVPLEVTDGLGRKYFRPIRHVALTDYPVIPGLGRFEAIAASLLC